VQARQQWAEAEGAKFRDHFAKAHPEFVKGSAEWRELNDLTAQMIEEDASLKADWHGYGASRSLTGQKLLAEAAVGRYQEMRMAAAKERLRDHEIESARHKSRGTLRPGVYRPSGSDSAADIGRLERAMENATGSESLNLARQLTQARRAAGLL
jgi:hypothetical protein